MATLSEADCRRMYSWWWDSHISPKNSKWLHDNLTDINAKVKTMIKLIEEDADSFAKRAEMYYKKRPELMKLVEEFYRAYRALAERYDHATGALHQAHRSMAEAFPNQIPLLMDNDSAANDMSTPVHTLKQVDDLFGSGGHSRFAEGKSRRRLTFDDAEVESCGDKRSNESIGSEFDLLTAKLESQSQDLADKDRELERLWVCIEDERSRFNDLQNVNSQAEEELQSMAQILRERDAHDQSLQHELDESKMKIQELGFQLESTVRKLTNENENLQVNFRRERSEKAYLTEELLGNISRLESCLVDANDELEVLKAKSKSLEDSCHVLVKQNAGLITENESLNSDKQKLEDMDKRFNELEGKYFVLEKEKQRTLFKVEELKVSLEGQKEEQVNFSNISESRLSSIESRIRLLQEESRQKNQELVEELDKALNSQIESFVLRKCVQELEEKNSALFIECQKLIETSESSENLISKLEIESREHQMKVEKENFTLLGEILSSTFLSVIFKELVSEKSEEMKQIQENVKVLQKENLNLKEALQKSEHELITVTFFTDQLNYEVANGKNLAKQKETELWEARWKLESTENQNWGLLVQVDDLKTKYNEQTKLIFKLSEENDRLNKENKCIADDLVQLHQEHEESQKREEKFKDLNAKLNILESENGQNFHSEKTKDNEFVGLQDLLNRVEAIERTLNSKKQEATQNPKPEISEVESKCLTKEIMLDQTSECELSHGRNSREAESQLVELWETVDHDSSIDLTVGRSNNNDIEYRQLLSVKTKNRFRHEEFTGDELDLSKRLAENRREGSKRKILEKLNSDVQKLTNLQITVQDLKNKVKTVKADVECESVIVELEEAEVAIEKLFDINDKLVKSFQEKQSSKETIENGSVSRRKIQEQARRASDKIGRLQLEIQKLQFVLMKIDDEKESRGKAGIVLDSKKRLLLRDYIYGGVRQSPRRKKSAFCGCIQPPTKG